MRRLSEYLLLATLALLPWGGLLRVPALSGGFRPFAASLTLAGLVLAVLAIGRARGRPSDVATWGMLVGMALDGLGQDVEDFRHVWVALGLADAGRRGTT